MATSRMILGFVVAFVLGMSAAGFIVHARMSSNLVTVRQTAREAQLASQEAFKKREEALLAEIAGLKQDLNIARETARKADLEPSDPLEFSSELPEEPPPARNPEPEMPVDEEKPRRDRRVPGEALSPEEREAMTERRRDFMTDMQERANTFLEDRMMQSTDPLEQERMAALQEYAAYMGDLRQQMRDAETDEAREQVGELIRTTREEMGGILREQQNYLLLQVAEEYGITGTRKQADFINRMQEIRRDPFFSAPMMPGSGRSGGRGWGGFGGVPEPGRSPREGR